MPKVITYSQQFPTYHPKAGQPTNFVAGFQNSFNMVVNGVEFFADFHDSFRSVKGDVSTTQIFGLRNDVERFRTQNAHHVKSHTIRSGNRFKKGDFFSPRVWSAKPYNSPQIIIGDD